MNMSRMMVSEGIAGGKALAQGSSRIEFGDSATKGTVKTHLSGNEDMQNTAVNTGGA
ncbi:hypothetical protein [Paenibacillus sp. HW567]|uniref:hypothetical protein n=1 Tax=Paenibacillus sp. HW567 TaxID=1034769 RepID=UPI000372099A|nr:hypothetical protein [Paenibacillus sp. HW567]